MDNLEQLVSDGFFKKPFTDEQFANLLAYLNTVDDERMLKYWKTVGAWNVENAIRLHKSVKDRIVAYVTSGKYNQGA
jgi:uncharacterized membrane protein YukC